MHLTFSNSHQWLCLRWKCNLFLNIPNSSILFPPLVSSPLQCPVWWQFRLRCGSLRTTLRLCHWWRSTSSAVPRRELSMTTPFRDITIVWPLFRPGARRPATRYRDCLVNIQTCYIDILKYSLTLAFMSSLTSASCFLLVRSRSCGTS